MARYVSPNGLPISGVLESVTCCATITDIDPVTGDVEYAGESEMFWDEQKPVMRNSMMVYLDDNNDEWTFDQIIKVEATEEV